MISDRTVHTLELNKILGLLRTHAVSDMGKEAVDALAPTVSLTEAERLLQETTEAESIYWRLGHTPIDVFPDIRRRASAVIRQDAVQFIQLSVDKVNDLRDVFPFRRQ